LSPSATNSSQRLVADISSSAYLQLYQQSPTSYTPPPQRAAPPPRSHTSLKHASHNPLPQNVTIPLSSLRMQKCKHYQAPSSICGFVVLQGGMRHRDGCVAGRDVYERVKNR